MALHRTPSCNRRSNCPQTRSRLHCSRWPEYGQSWISFRETTTPVPHRARLRSDTTVPPRICNCLLITAVVRRRRRPPRIGSPPVDHAGMIAPAFARAAKQRIVGRSSEQSVLPGTAIEIPCREPSEISGTVVPVVSTPECDGFHLSRPRLQADDRCDRRHNHLKLLMSLPAKDNR